MDLSGIDLYLVGGGVVAFILLVLMLRFALRGTRPEPAAGMGLQTPVAPGLGLDPRAGSASAATTGRAGVRSEPTFDHSTVASASDRGSAVSASAAGPEVVHGAGVEAPVGGAAGTTRAAASYAESARSPGTPNSHGDAVVGRISPEKLGRIDATGCPKCGERFLVGEMEGPTLMIDGVSREDFQPLLTARECSGCGYLEFYTKPLRD